MPPALRLVASAGALMIVAAYGPPSAEAAGEGREAYSGLVRREASAAGLPFDIADAVMAIESGYNPGRVGSVGEIGLMQVRPGTARMLGFTGSLDDLAKPEVNIHYGVAYLAGAWRQANGDLCRALMKYRAGHGQEMMTPLSVSYCGRARAHLASLGSIYAGAPLRAEASSAPVHLASVRARPTIPKLDIRLRGAAFWAAHEARIKAITALVEKRWRRLASR